ncbi:MAG TPA: acyl-CoA dehydrogenase family protein [Candidatus Binataceae bacterium]|jgi:alkylation response protein AidB-like acyl-CoA dehydrogenase|nr:acyl-CoA dehydrogenase family protein [Candidatus Binataceae bacterium]
MSEGANEGERLIAAAAALKPKIREAAAEIEQGRRLPAHIVDAMRKIGIFRMAMPRAWGGPEIDPIAQLRVIEVLSEADGSVGWCAMINSDSGYFSAFLDQDVAREMYRDIDASTASSLLWAGRAQPVDGGFRLSGRWPFCSGCTHSQWFVGSSVVHDGDAPRVGAGGVPDVRLCFVPIAEGEILDTWYSTGLRGSGSNDFQVRDIFVPAQRVCSLIELPVRRPGPLYAWPLMFAYNFPGITLGIARSALDTFAEMAARKPVTAANLIGRRAMLREEGYAQTALARAEALVRSARGFIYETMEEIWATLVRGEPLPLRLRALYRLAMVHAHEACTSAVDMLYKANGGGSVYQSGPLDRYFRDIHTINQHTLNGLKTYENAGAALMGLTPLDPLF